MKKLCKKTLGKRILSVVLAFGMVLALVPMAQFGITVEATGNSDIQAYYYGSGANEKVVRGVLDQIQDLPQYTNANWETTERGTAERPFFILEIVPDESIGHLGYLIEGCEPVKMNELFGNENVWGDLKTYSDSIQYTKADKAYFFADEKEADAAYYTNSGNWDDNKRTYAEDGRITLCGYYERVGDGKGKFAVNAEGTAIEPKANGNLVWHTVNSFTNGFDENNFKQAVGTVSLSRVGDRIYTKRTNDETHDYYEISGKYFYYWNREIFLTECLGLTKEQAKNYSVMIKTITPSELNTTKDWVQYADLVYVTPISHKDAMITMWKNHNRLGHNTSITASPDSNTAFIDNDLSWNVTKALFNKITAETNYAAMILDNGLYGMISQGLENCTYNAYNFNMDLVTTYKEKGVDNNLYKLILMTCCVNPNLVKNIFLDRIKADRPDDGTSKAYIQGLQTGDAAKYWGNHFFFLLNEAEFRTWQNGNTGYSPISYWNRDWIGNAYNPSDWANYGYMTNFNTETGKAFVQGRVYTFKGNNSLTMDFESGSVGSNENVYTDFATYLATDEQTKSIWQNIILQEATNAGWRNQTLSASTAPPSFAIRYILGLGTDFNRPVTGNLRVLEIEPSVGVNTSANYTPIWKLKDSYIYMLVPGFSGTIQYDRMTMSSFVGRINDLNSEYDLIYLGDDIGAYNTDTNGKTDFVDDNLDGKIYFHNGDLVKNHNKDDDWGPAKRDVDFVDGIAQHTARFPGNDITKVKSNDLVEYMISGYPIVAEEKLFVADNMEACSNIWNFVNTYNINSTSNPLTGGNGLLHTNQASIIESKIRANRISVEFLETPVIYDEVHYLPTDGESSQMNFKIKVDQKNKYNYKLFIDQDRNGKFEDDEWVKEGEVTDLEQSIPYSTSNGEADGIVGLVQWKLVVYLKTNHGIRDSVEGCSAIKCLDSTKKNTINVLQIIPSTGSTSDDLTSDAYRNLYENLDAFKITVTKIKWSDFEKYFIGSDFKYDMGAGIVPGSNPSSDSLQKLRTNAEANHYGYLEDYNMIVIGFKDGFDRDDLRNLNGAADYLYYYAALGRSILFTHDNTSFFNTMKYGSNDYLYKDRLVSGYTSNAMLRDLMGMNRFGMESNQLEYITDQSGTKRDYLSEALKNFRAGTPNDFASWRMVDGTRVTDPYVQGYTIGALTRLGSNGGNAALSGNVMPYKNYSFKDDNDLSQLAVRMNEGQITQYPYNIDRNMTIGKTHTQYYMANMEDPELTVWYTLEYGPAYGKGGDGKIHSASPQDAASSYYIYSKGNVFYSGVGHSSTGSEMEKKLFVNTMIAAYRAIAKPPTVKITNPEASKVGSDKYTLSVPRELNTNAAGNLVEEDLGISTVRVEFMPKDANLSNALKCHIFYTGETPGDTTTIKKVYHSGTNREYTADPSDSYYLKDNTGKYLANGEKYYFDYPKSNLNAHPKLTFEIMNDRLPELGITYLEIIPQPLFMLD